MTPNPRRHVVVRLYLDVDDLAATLLPGIPPSVSVLDPLNVDPGVHGLTLALLDAVQGPFLDALPTALGVDLHGVEVESRDAYQPEDPFTPGEN